MSTRIPPIQDAAARVFCNRRIVPFNREQVWEAWTDPSRLALWFGPTGFSSTFHEFDPRAGGIWRFTMHGPDGQDYPNENRFAEFIRPERIVYDHLSLHAFRVTASFDEHEDGTLLGFSMEFADQADWDRCSAFVPDKNEENFDRLEALLSSQNESQTGASNV